MSELSLYWEITVSRESIFIPSLLIPQTRDVHTVEILMGLMLSPRVPIVHCFIKVMFQPWMDSALKHTRLPNKLRTFEECVHLYSNRICVISLIVLPTSKRAKSCRGITSFDYLNTQS